MKRDERGGVGLGILAAFGGILLVIGIGIGIYALVYGTAETRGRIALHNQQRSAEQIQNSYEFFHDTCRGVIADTFNLDAVQSQANALQKRLDSGVDADPLGQDHSQLIQLQTQATGISNLRDRHAQDYNAKSHEFTHNWIKSHDLPVAIGPPDGTPYEDLSCESQGE